MEFVNLHNRSSPTPLAWEGQTPRAAPTERAELAQSSAPSAGMPSADVGRTTLSSQSSGAIRIEIASVGTKQSKELRVSRLDPPRSFHECKELVLVVDGTPHVGVARHRGRAHQGHLLENLDMALTDELVGALRAASRATLQICGTRLELETAMRERLPLSTTAQATAQLMPPLKSASTLPRMSAMLEGVTLVMTGTAAPADSVTLTLAAQAPRDAGASACEVKLLADGKAIALPALARSAGAYGDEYRTSLALTVVEQLSTATRIVGKVCDQRFQLSDAHLTELRELVIKLREERELSGP